MATPRKRWFRVADGILREDFTAEQRSTFLGLLAWFNQRRQRDGCKGVRAQEASIPPGDLLTITLAATLEAARECCKNISERFELVIEPRGAFTFVRWPNLAKFQEWGRPSRARRLPAKRPPIARELPSPAPSPAPSPNREEVQEEEKKETASPAGPAPLARTAPEVPAPRSKKEPSNGARERAAALAVLVRAAVPGQRIPANLDLWAADIELLNARDEWAWAEIDRVIDWIFHGNSWKWNLNIRSAKTLREKFAYLHAQMLSPNGASQAARIDPKRPVYPEEAWERRLAAKTAAAGGES